MNIQDFINELKNVVIYHKTIKCHTLGNEILTKKDMRTMLKNYYPDQFEYLKWNEQNKIIDKVFKELK